MVSKRLRARSLAADLLTVRQRRDQSRYNLPAAVSLFMVSGLLAGAALSVVLFSLH